MNDSTLKHKLNNYTPKIMDIDMYTSFAIFLPLTSYHGKRHILFEVRSSNITQPGEICFPGGKVDKTDRDEQTAAMRECSEELGVSMDKLEVYGALDYMITPYRTILSPYVGTIPENESLNINPNEVAETFSIPLDELVELEPKTHHIYLRVEPEESFPYHLIPQGEEYPWRNGVVEEHFYEYKGRVIWGLTARILKHFIEDILLEEDNDH